MPRPSAKSVEVESNGVVLHAAPLCENVFDLPEDDKNELLDRKSAEVERALAEIEANSFKLDEPVGRKHAPVLPAALEMSWLDLKFVNCRACGRVLLSPQHEPVRKKCRGKHCLSHLPQPVAAKRTETLYNGLTPVKCHFFVCIACCVGG